MVDFRVLGPLQVVAVGGEAVSLGRAQQRAVLALLLIHTPEPVSRDRLVDGLWGERPPASAEHAVQVYVSGIRKILRAGGGEATVRGSAAGYALDVDPERVDARRLERMIGEAQRVLAVDPEAARGLYERAFGLWRGPPLAELSQFDFAAREAERLQELHAVAVEGVVEAKLALGEHEQVIGQITPLVAAEPLRERPRRLLMLALYRSGRHAEALAAYRDVCAALDEIGLQPGPELRQLEQDILRHDVSLAPPAATAEVAGDESRGGAPATSLRARPRELPIAGMVTMLFTDIEWSTGLAERLGDLYPELLAEHHRLLRGAIEATGGYEVSTAGDSFFVAFADADAALDCACRAQRLFGGSRWPDGESVRVRMGIHTGAPAVQDGTYVGMAVHCAARVMAVAHGGQVLLTQAAVDALRSTVEVLDLGHHRLKDLPAAVHLFQPVAVDLPAEFPRLRSMSNSNLPAALQGLIGRSSEVSTALQMLARSDVRLVTMLGPGGAGKTRLALEVATEAVTSYRDGAWLVSLAPLADASLIASEIARTLGVRETEGRPLDVTLVDALTRRELLLVLDNFEHLVAGAGLITRLLEAAPGVSVLVTSRAALHLRGEHRMQVEPLAQADAAELFFQRARAVRSDAITEHDDREAVGRICLRLDGLPLALELAAARVAVFGVRALEARLAQRLDLTEGPRDLPDRQRTLRATIDWSYQLLSPGEKTLFRALACFAGGARLDAIESVRGDLDVDRMQTLAALVDNSLVRRRDDPDGEPRFWMLETIREYATERLAEEAIADAIATKHARHYLEFAQEAERHIHTRDQAAWLGKLDVDHDNLRVASHHLIAADPAGAARIAAALGRFWDIRGHLSEARENLVRVLASPLADGAAAAKANFFLGRLTYFAGDYAEAGPLLEQALQLAREGALRRFEVLALSHIAMVALSEGQPDRSIELHEEALAIATAENDDWTLSVALNSFGLALQVIGETERARAMLQEALELGRRRAEPMGIALPALNLADLALETGDLATAQSLISESLRSAREIDYPSTVTTGLALSALLALHREELETAEARIAASLASIRSAYNVISATRLLAAAATLAATRGDPLRAAQLWAASDRANQQLGSGDFAGARRLREVWLPEARRAVDAAAWQAEWDAGADLTPQQALDLVDPHAETRTHTTQA